VRAGGLSVGQRRTSSSSPPAWLLFGVVGLLCSLLYAADLSATVTAGTFLVVGVGTAAALWIGPRRNDARPRLPWRLLGSASILFLAGALIRPWAAQQSGLMMALADAFTVPGYALMFLGFGALLRARGSLERHAVTDGAIVCLGVGLVSITVFGLPALDVGGRPKVVSILAGLYPVLDTAVLLVLVNLAFTTAVRTPSFRLLASTVGLLLVGDLGYAYIGAAGKLSGPAWMDLPFLAGYTCLGCAALHPSMAELGRSLARPVQAWSRSRLLLLLPALAAPFVLTIVGRTDPGARWAIGLTGAAMVSALVVRATSAVTSYARAQEVFRFQATHDGLTGLVNRAAASGAIDRMLAAPRARDRTVWLFFLDLDGFKLVNDTWGHDAGDRLIVAVARRLRAAAPERAVVARLGGDEFVVAQVTDREEAEQTAGRLLAQLEAPLSVGGADIVVTASMGLAGAADGASVDALMRDADTAMYQAKSDGRGRWVVFDPSMHRRVRERVETELALRYALAHGQLHVAYQPIVQLASGVLVGAEALVRWDHPIRGPIPPVDFIPIAEEAGLIDELGDFVLTEALQRTAQWRREGVVPRDFWMSVNVSPRQLRDERVLNAVRESLRENGLPAEALVLEITESVMLGQSDSTRQLLQALRGLGVRLVVDDFGTGFSALGYLRQHPVTGVKIDRSFVDGLGRDPEDEEIVRAVVAMSAALGLSIVAEGVETPSQRDVLASIGVELGQGRLWSMAVGPADFARLAARAPGPLRPSLHLLAGNS
jgi:diguanylate cyclase (GGDEF)-like protein